ncbi:hypothetical protein [Shinella sp. NM-101]|uniref:hypothetical protein n=1 Tax=Shinella sp. NM-101 TaxID=2744455 RepID=UPI001F2189F2|nr:hypothetical protein [Shinella sp. NM-101]
MGVLLKGKGREHAPGLRLLTKCETLSSVMLGPVPSIHNVSISNTFADPRHKAEDDGGG